MLWGIYIPLLLAKQCEQRREKQISFLQLSKCGEAKYTQEERVYFRPQKIQYIIHIVRKKSRQLPKCLTGKSLMSTYL